MAAEFTGPQLAHFREALLAAFPKWADLGRVVQDLDKSLAAIGGGEGAPLEGVVDTLLGRANSDGWARRLLKAALARNQDSPSLKAFVGALAAAGGAGGGAFDARGPVNAYMSKSSFDLDDQEKQWRKSFADSIEKRLLAFVLRDADDDVFDQLTERVQRHLASMPPVLPQVVKVSLKPTLAAAQEALARLTRWKSELDTRHVLCTVYADVAGEQLISQFFQGVREQYPGVLGRFLVIVFRVGAEVAVPADLVELPPPAFEKWHLNEWVRNVTQGTGWPDELVARFAKWVLRLALYEDTLTAGSVYDALARAIALLSENPTPEILIQRIEAGG